jgi:hypothetical protein
VYGGLKQMAAGLTCVLRTSACAITSACLPTAVHCACDSCSRRGAFKHDTHQRRSE